MKLPKGWVLVDQYNIRNGIWSVSKALVSGVAKYTLWKSSVYYDGPFDSAQAAIGAIASGLPDADFNGPVYEPEYDKVRLTGQIQRVFALMTDGRWRTLSEIEEVTGDPAASISAQLRHLRKDKFGSHTVEKRPRGNRKDGLWEYQLTVNKVEMHGTQD